MSPWQDLVTASLIGTERAAVPVLAVPGAPTRAGAPADPAALVLDHAALLTAARRGGRRPGRAEPAGSPPLAADPETAPVVSRAAGRRLARMLGGEHTELLPEWLAAAAGRGRRVPARLLPALLHHTRRGPAADLGLRRLVTAAGGARARWLAGLNPEWNFVLAYAPAGEDAWRLGDAAQRRGYLAALRARDPGAARDLVTASWDAAGWDERVMFLSALADRMSLADESLLDGALDDCQPRVRRAAADLLAALPGSALAQRMADRARECLHLDPGTSGARLVVSPPGACDAAMRRDGITPGGDAQPASRRGLLLDVIASTPLRTWTDRFGMRPAAILALPAGGWEAVLFAAWSRAAIAQSRPDQGRPDHEARAWMAAMISQSLTDGAPGLRGDGSVLARLARRADPALGAPGALPGSGPDHPPVLDEAVKILRFRYEMHRELNDDDGAG
jgi:uncharacterized protein DUF5691